MKIIIIIFLFIGISSAGFYDEGVYNNHFLWFHVMGGAILTVAFVKIFDLKPLTAFVLVSSLAISWEVFEYLNNDVVAVYGSQRRWAYDSTADILGAVIPSITITFML